VVLTKLIAYGRDGGRADKDVQNSKRIIPIRHRGKAREKREGVSRPRGDGKWRIAKRPYRSEGLGGLFYRGALAEARLGRRWEWRWGTFQSVSASLWPSTSLQHDVHPVSFP